MLTQTLCSSEVSLQSIGCKMLGGDPDSTFSEVRFKIYVQKGTLAKSTADFFAYFDEKKYPYKPPRVYMTKFDTSD